MSFAASPLSQGLSALGRLPIGCPVGGGVGSQAEETTETSLGVPVLHQAAQTDFSR